MTKTMRVLGMASALALAAAAPCFAAGGSLGSQNTTQSQLGNSGQNQMLAKPSNGAAQTSNSTYGMNNTQTGTTYSTPSVSTSGPGSATNPASPSPSGGGSGGSGSGSGGGSGSR